MMQRRSGMVLGTTPRGLAMVKAKSDAVWFELNVDTLAPELAKAYAEYKELYRQMKAQRLAFETSVSEAAELPEGKRMVFGYNFGKLSVAIVDDDRKPAKASPAKQSLADFIASQASAGRRV